MARGFTSLREEGPMTGFDRVGILGDLASDVKWSHLPDWESFDHRWNCERRD